LAGDVALEVPDLFATIYGKSVYYRIKKMEIQVSSAATRERLVR
jgi:hypothetical protein